MSNQLMRSELEKIALNNKTYSGLVGISILPFLLLLVDKAGFSTDSPLPTSPSNDGWQAIITSMRFAMHVFAPLIIAMMAADTLASEAENGTLKLTLTKPISRSKYLTGKLLSQAILAFSFLFVFAVTSFLCGFILGYNTFYGVDMTGMPSTLVTIPSTEIWWRMTMFFGFAAFGSFIVAALAIAVSTVSNSGTTVTATTFIVYMITEILGGVLNTKYVDYLLSPAIKRLIWSQLSETVVWADVIKYFIVVLMYGLSAILFSYFRFTRKDIN